MNLLQITRNAENQVAASLKVKVERFMKSKKSESRLALLLDIRNLAHDLQEITCRKTDYDMLSKPEKVSPLPTKDRIPPGMQKCHHCGTLLGAELSFCTNCTSSLI